MVEGTRAIQLEKYPVFASSSKTPIRTKDHIIFSNREFYLDTRALERYKVNLKKYLEEPLSDAARVMIMAHLQNLEDSLDTDRSYAPNFGSIQVDEKNELELTGAPVYAKSYQVIYDFSKYADVMLAYLCGIDYDVLCDRLQENLIKFSLDYNIFSSAIMTYNIHLLSRFPIGVLFGLSEQLDRFFEDLLASKTRRRIKLHGESIDLSSAKLLDAELLFHGVAIQIWDLLQYIFEEFVVVYNKNLLFNPKSSHYITSKGYANIVLQADAHANPQPLDITCRGMTFRVDPYISTRGEYFKIFGEM